LREILTGRELEHHLETEVNCIPRERFASVCKTAWKRAVLGGSVPLLTLFGGLKVLSSQDLSFSFFSMQIISVFLSYVRSSYVCSAVTRSFVPW